MALDNKYFDSIHIDLVKRKYHYANEVEAVLQDIRRQAAALHVENETLRTRLSALTEENEAMRAKLGALNDQKVEIGGAVLSAQAIYREVLAKANQRAEEIVAAAERRRQEIIEETWRRQEHTVQYVESCYSRLKQQHLASIEALNAEWQDFLCGLLTEDEELFPAPNDLEQKVGAIAQELLSMEGDPDGETEESVP